MCSRGLLQRLPWGQSEESLNMLPKAETEPRVPANAVASGVEEPKALRTGQFPSSFFLCSQQSLTREQRPQTFSSVLLLLCVLSYIQLFATLCTVAHQAPLSMGFSRQEY